MKNATINTIITGSNHTNNFKNKVLCLFYTNKLEDVTYCVNNSIPFVFSDYLEPDDLSLI